MGDTKIDFSQRLKVYERKIADKLKNAFIGDTSPFQMAAQMGGTPSVRVIEQFNERHSLASLLPYESYDRDTGIYFNRDTVGFMLYCVPATAISSAELKVLNSIFSMRHKPNTSIQVSLYSDPNIEPILDNWKHFGSLSEDDKFKPMLNMLAQNRVDYLKLGKWKSLFSDESSLMKNVHLVISYTIPVPAGIAPVDIAEEDIKFLQRKRSTISGALRSSHIFSKPMEPDALITLLDGLLNPSNKAKKPVSYDQDNLINSQCVDADTMALWGAGLSSIVHDDKPYSVLPFHIRQFPRIWPGFKNGELIGSFANNVMRHACPFLMTMTVNVPDQVSEKGRVTKKQLRATQMAGSSVAKFVPQWADRKKDWDYVHSKVDEGNKMLEAFFQLVLFCPEGREQSCEQSLKSIFDSFGWLISRSRYTPIHSFLGALPMGVCQDTYKALKVFGHYSKRLSWTCTNLAPWIGEFKGTQNPLLLLSGRKGQVSYFDNFDNNEGNYNISCCGTSGCGKSFFTQELVQRTLTDGGRVFIIDAGHSYRNISSLLGGTYIDFGKKTPKFNPFSSISEEDPKHFLEQMPLLKTLFQEMASPDSSLSSKQKAVLEKAIQASWQELGNKCSVTTVVNRLKSDSSDDGLMDATAKDLSVMLHPYTKDGMYGHHFTGESNIDLDNNFIVLELDALNHTPDLQSVVLLILMMRITQIMYLSGNRSQRKLCIIDEAWRLLGRGNAGEFIEEGYRVARKHGGCFMTITQKISDYYSSTAAKVAFMNSDISIYLRQKPEELTQAENEGHIDNSDGKVDILRGLKTEQGKYSELAINSPKGLSVHRFYVDPVAAKLYSTTAKDVDFIMEQQDKGHSVLEAVEMLVANEHKVGTA